MAALYFITGNRGKYTEAKAIIPRLKQLKLDLLEIQSLDTHIIMRAKLDAAFAHHDGPFVVEDTSLTFDCLGQLPGPLVKWFIESIGLERLSELPRNYNNYKAVVTNSIGYAENRDNIQFFEAFSQGTIVAPRGLGGFGFDPIFVPDGYSKTLAELTPDQKQEIGSRFKAFDKLKAAL